MSKEALDILEEYWGYTSFRPYQEEIVDCISSKSDCSALLPTGGGKSICYQVPALMMEGFCLVISPLIALMKDQVHQLKRRNISAAALHSGLSRKEMRGTLDRAVQGEYKLLYVSPERLSSREFIGYLKNCKLSFIAVDEAHCISQWGFDFRPEYRMISELRKEFVGINVIALTATATPEVLEDIRNQLLITDGPIFKASFFRPNLSYRIVHTENKRQHILNELGKEDSAIIYVRNRRKTKEISDWLRSEGYSSCFYHAGLDHKTRNQVQQDWISSRTKVIVATNAFGMGIDKGNVHVVIHYAIPDGIESYYQEAGRAGRDGKFAKCILLYNEADKKQSEQQLQQQYPKLKFVELVYEALGNYLQLALNSGLGTTHPFVLSDFCKRFNFNYLDAYNALVALERLGYVRMSEAFFQPFKVKILLDSRAIYNYRVKHKTVDEILKYFLRAHNTIIDQFTRIDINHLKRSLNISDTQFRQKMLFLKEQSVIDIIEAQEQPHITFLRARTHEITDPNSVLLNQKKRNGDRLQSMLSYAESEECRAVTLSNYFGEHEVEECGICDICELKKKVSSKPTKGKKKQSVINELLEEKPMTRSEILQSLPTWSEEDVDHCLDWLFDREELQIIQGGRLLLVK